MYRSFVVLLAGLVLSAGAPARSQEAVLQCYGSGVHAFFAQDYSEAYNQLTTAIDARTDDPRAFYFRGLAFMKLGRPDEAVADFKAGASLETQDINGKYNVAKALERVQGSARVELERYRVSARMATLERNEQARKARYEAIRREEARVVIPSKPAEVAEPAENPIADTAPGAGMGSEPAANEKPADANDPFAEPGDAATKPAAGTTPAETTPATETPAAGTPATDTPATETPATETPAMETTTPVEADPAADDTPKAGGKKTGIFGKMGRATMKAMGGGAKPAGLPGMTPVTKPAGGDDPFGAPAVPGTTVPGVKPAVPPKPSLDPKSADGDDPFGAAPAATDAPAMPAEKPADGGDPFSVEPAAPAAGPGPGPAPAPAVGPGPGPGPGPAPAPAKDDEDPFGS